MKMSLAKMNVAELITLRRSIDKELTVRTEQIRTQLRALGKEKTKASPRKGRKIPPRYRGPKGETWAGRGERPRWLVALVGKRKSPEKYRIEGGVPS